MRTKTKLKSRIPLMSEGEERFMAYCGLIQWAEGVTAQSRRVREAVNALSTAIVAGNHMQVVNRIHCEEHYFVVAAHKVLEYRAWSKRHGLFQNVDFSELDGVNAQDIQDVRNMREHVVDYFQGDGHTKDRWTVETPEFTADASSTVGPLIGGRLDYVHFTAIIERLLPMLHGEPIPYPRPL